MLPFIHTVLAICYWLPSLFIVRSPSPYLATHTHTHTLTPTYTLPRTKSLTQLSGTYTYTLPRTKSFTQPSHTRTNSLTQSHQQTRTHPGTRPHKQTHTPCQSTKNQTPETFPFPINPTASSISPARPGTASQKSLNPRTPPVPFHPPSPWPRSPGIPPDCPLSLVESPRQSPIDQKAQWQYQQNDSRQRSQSIPS